MADFFGRESTECGFQLRTNFKYEELRARLRSEYGPAVQSDAESARALGDVDKDLDDCDAEIHRLQSHILVLQTQRERLEEYKSCLRSLACPIRKLPNEILARIFDYTCDMNAVCSHNLKRMPALALSGVCGRWRILARSSSVLWSRVKIDLRATSPDPRELLVLKLYIACSELSPLTIEIVGEATDNHASLLAILTDHRYRWQRLYLARPSIWVQMIIQGFEFPLLEVLEVPTFSLLARHLKAFQNASRLRRLAVSSVSSLQQDFPWKQLTSIDFSYHAANEEGTALLQACHALKEMCLYEKNVQSFTRCPSPVLTPALELLLLDLCQTSHTESLADEAFASIISPSLTSLLVHGRLPSTTRYARTWPKENLHSFLLRSSCRLTTLSIKRIPLSGADLTDLLPILPSLLNLTIDDTNVAADETPLTSRFVKSLHAFRGTGISSALVPTLQSLSLTSSASASLDVFDGFKDRDFVDMVLSRRLPNPHYAAQVGVACLRSVVLQLRYREVDEEVYKPLQHIEKAGMRVVVTGKSS